MEPKQDGSVPFFCALALVIDIASAFFEPLRILTLVFVIFALGATVEEGFAKVSK